jgi:hypothetical protein
MIQVPPNANVVVMHEAVNFRYGITIEPVSSIRKFVAF